MSLAEKRTIRNTVLALAISVIALLSFAQVSHALTQADVDFICGIFNCTDEQRTRAEALIDEEAGTVLSPTLIGDLKRYLFRGISGDDVELLQEILATDPDIYPEALVTGFFGPLTEKAVKNFQKRFGIDQVGVVGPITRATFNGIVTQNVGRSGKIPPGLLKKFGGATISGTDNGNGTTTDDGNGTTTDNGGPSTSAVHSGKILVCHAPGGNLAKARILSVGAPAMGAHMAHGDTFSGACGGGFIGGTGDGGDEVTTMADAQQALDDAQQAIDDAQVAIDASSGTTTDAVALLADAQSKLDAAQTAFDSAEYKDAKELAGEAEQLAADAEAALEEEDITAPVISNVFTENIASTTADVVWTTDENADSTVWYATSTPVVADGDGVSSMTDSSLVEEHSLTLSDLTASSTYYYFVGSADADNNKATSPEETFTTL